ncbi:MAG TPA: serine hydrolase, partial [Burkholderiaceae bacterium]|nr:serine hydrolase [Burkholderiaceae bacterium]
MFLNNNVKRLGVAAQKFCVAYNMIAVPMHLSLKIIMLDRSLEDAALTQREFYCTICCIALFLRYFRAISRFVFAYSFRPPYESLCMIKLFIYCLAASLLLANPQMVWAGKAELRSAASTSKSAKAVASKKKANRKRLARSVKRRGYSSVGHRSGLHRVDDPLNLRSSVALVVDQDTDEILIEKNSEAVLPIASITKLMTALVTMEAGLDLNEELTVTRADRTVDRIRSRLRPGIRLTRAEALHLALMSSENHAAHLLGRTYPGGMSNFVEAMNAKARLLGMDDTHFADPTGLSAKNRSSPQDLVRLVKAAHRQPLMREYSTSTSYQLDTGKRVIRYGNTNRLTSNPQWDIGLQKTGYISAAG